MKRVLVSFVCLNAATAIVLTILSNQAPHTRSAVGTDGTTDRKIVIDLDDDLAKTKTELIGQADQALQKATEAVEKSGRSDLGPQVEQLSETVKRLKGEIASATTASALDALRERKLKELGVQSAEIVDEASAARSTWGNTITTIALLLGLTVAVVLGLTTLHFRGRVIDLECGLRNHQDLIDRLTEKVSKAQTSISSIEVSQSRSHEDLRQQIAAARKSNESRPEPELIEPAVIESEPRFFTALEPIESEPSFPALVSEYLSRIGESRKHGVEAHFPQSIFVPTSDEPVRFMFVANDDGDEAGIVLPTARLQRGQDFSSYYKLYYTCAEPTAGEVYIVSPATVTRVDSGWRLLEKGQMEIH